MAATTTTTSVQTTTATTQTTSTGTTQTTTATPPQSTISTDGTCSGAKGLTCQGSVYGNCCSQYGYCGRTNVYCGAGCQSGFGTCGGTPPVSTPPVNKVSPDGTCAGVNGYTCKGSAFGNCCSKNGYCGGTNAYCGAGCQGGFGTCVSVIPVKNVSKDGTCGGANGYTCQASSFGNCCSKNGYCGSTTPYCGADCQGGFGTCN